MHQAPGENDGAPPAPEALGDERELALDKTRTAALHAARGELDDAFRLLTADVLPTLTRLGDARAVVQTRLQLTLVLLKRRAPGDAQAAAEQLDRALAEARALNLPVPQPVLEQIRKLQREAAGEDPPPSGEDPPS